MGFMSVAPASGHTLRALTVIDTCTRVTLVATAGFGGQQVVDVLSRVGITRGLPSLTTVTHGAASTSRALDHWTYTNSVKSDYIRRCPSVENAIVECFCAAARRESLSRHYYSNVVTSAACLARGARSTTTLDRTGRSAS